MSDWVIEAWFDGCCEPINPGGMASYGAFVKIGSETVWECSEIYIPVAGREKETLNNLAEYSGLIAILEYLVEGGFNLRRSIVIRGDSKLVIEQMSGRWRILKGAYVPLALRAKQLLMAFSPKPTLLWIPRDQNGIADELSKAKLKKAGVEFRIQREAS